jgi:hypothetical protein
MRTVSGVVLIIAGIAAGLYFGFWWAFIGGIIQVVTEIRQPTLDAMNIALGILRIMGAGLIGHMALLVLVIPGINLFNK